MSTAAKSIQVWALALYRRPSTLQEYQQTSRRFLAGLQNSSHIQRFSAIGRTGSTAVAPDLTGLEDTIAVQVFDEAHPHDYCGLSSSGNLGPQSLSRTGFSLSYGISAADGQSILSPEAGGMLIRVRGSSASVEPEASVELELTEKTLARTAADLRGLLKHAVSAWGCSFGGVYVPTYRQLFRSSDRPSYAGQWLFYLPFPHLARCLPADIHHEPFANGILIQTTPHLPDANNPADVAAGRRVRDVLDEFGLVNDATYAIEGWPPDPEETIYEQFISGAPANRKYTVHCINFDGYDPDRKVLLYAKLFRRLKRHPKAWGLRGWDGPVLNEAKRQVRAAAKAGGVPIEWHIGFEEPANAVRELIANYTDITEQQLRVIYTPLAQAVESPAI